MAQHHVEQVIGRLSTDEAFRRSFLRDATRALEATGLPLTRTEREALAATDASVWQWVASRLDPRLQKIAVGDGESAPGGRP